MALPLAALAIGAVPSLLQFGTGVAQRRRANNINPVDPGFAENTGLLDNKVLASNLYDNFTLPGKSGIINSLEGNYANAMNAINNAATSSEDILSGVTSLSANKDQALLDLGIAEGEAKRQLLPMVMQTNAAYGEEAVRRNQFQLDRYNQDLDRKANLEVSGATNMFKSADSLATLGTSLLNYTSDSGVGGFTDKQKKAYDTYSKRRAF